jgi:ABC-type bacteriocin/lantibiotic exporter with double-glycine peptidase domain
MNLDNINEGVFDAPSYKGNPVKRFFKLLSLDRKDLTRVYIFALMSGGIALTLPLAVQGIISQIMAAQVTSSLYILIALVCLATVFSGIFQIMQLRILEDIQRRIFTRTSFEFAHKIPRFRIENFSSEYPPELINRFFDILTVEKNLPKIILDLSVSIVSIILGLVLLSFYHPFFVFFGFILLVFLYIVFRYTGEKGLNTKLKESSYKYKLASWLEELGRSIVTFKIANEPNISLYKADNIINDYLDVREKHFGVLITQYGMVITFKVLIITGLLIMGAYLVISQEINLGQFVAAEIIIFIVISAVEKLIYTLRSVYEVLVGMEKIAQVLSLPLENANGINFKEADNDKGISIKTLNLNYYTYNDEVKALSNLNLNIEAGERVCIIGKSGAGKSTLVHLLSGIYCDYNGSLSFNNIPAQNFEVSSLRSKIGCCFYPEDIFVGTIAENIILGNEDLFPAMIDCLEKLGMLDFIKSLPDGFNTIMYPENRRYPKSIIKKIILARNIIKKPKLLILDDLLMQIQQEERQSLIDYLVAKEHPWTLILISNEAKIAAVCDRIVELKNGVIITDLKTDEAFKVNSVKEILK